MSDKQDTRLPLEAALLGVLTAIAVSSWLGAAGPITCLVASCLAGTLLLPSIFAYLPPFNLWLVPIMSLVGGAAVMLDRRNATRAPAR